MTVSPDLKAHSELGASGMERWAACFGSVRRNLGKVSPSSVYAEEGTAAHTLAESCLRNGSDPIDHLGSVIVTEAGSSFEVTDEMVEAVTVYVSFVRQVLADNPGAKLDVERKFHLTHLHAGLYGTADAVVVAPYGDVWVIDLKYGRGKVVEVKGNPQLPYYGIGACMGEDPVNVHLFIVQPRAYHPDGKVRGITMSFADLTRWGNEVLLPAALATEDPNAPLVAGDYCRWCPSKPDCPELRRAAMEPLGLALTGVEYLPAQEAKDIIIPAPAEMSDAALAKMLEVAPILASLAESITEEAKKRIRNGHGVVGWKIINGQARRGWVDDAAAIEEMELAGVPAYVTPEPKLRSPAQAEKELKSLGLKPKMVSEILSKHIIKTFGEKLVPETEPGEPIYSLGQALPGVGFMDTDY